ncbi:MAG: porin [Geminicoccaceae bacterium]|nr:porin [Geminicoccaceae bacterium]MCX7630231.1 porin [Geminicoccaceae bacterium]
MTMKKMLLGTSALLGAGMLATASPALAQPGPQVTPVGKLNVSVGGFARFLWILGDTKERLNAQLSSSDFRNDMEVHVIARSKDESTGIEYGATIEFEADTSRNDNTDETWIFLRGAFGELRFGDEDGASDLMKIGAFTLAAGTGGLDGTIDYPRTVAGANTADATKIVYFTPRLAGFQLGVSYTPAADSVANGGRGDTLALTNVDGLKDTIEAGLNYVGTFGDVGVRAGVIGHIGDNTDGDNDEDFWKLYGGAVLSFAGFSVGGGYGKQDFFGREHTWFNIGAGAELGPAKLSVNFGKVLDDDLDQEERALIFSATVGILPGVALDADLQFFDMDRGPTPVTDEDDGVLGLVRLNVAF